MVCHEFSIKIFFEIIFRQDEELLKKVVKELGVIYGTEAIKPIFNAVIQESHNGKSLEIKADQKAMEGYFEEKLETDHSTATQEKVKRLR